MSYTFNRRDLLKMASALAVSSTSAGALAAERKALRTPILSSEDGEDLAVIGLGTSRTFTRPDDAAFQAQLAQVMQIFFDQGGELIDSSPMYGPAESIVGKLLPRTSNTADLFAATKVWTDGQQSGIEQMNDSILKMGVKTMDLMQIHNLRDWRLHLATLRKWKEAGKVRYIGITTSHGRAHDELLQIMRTEPLDFVQFTYSIGEPEAEDRLLPTAADNGITTLINRPYQRGALFKAVAGQTVPEWAVEEADVESWGQFFLKYVLSHPAASVVIPATSKPKHMLDNAGAGFGRLPTAATRKRMQGFMKSL